jgi:hypothetical protein
MYCVGLREAGNADSDLSIADQIVDSPEQLREAFAEVGCLETAQ